MWYVPFFHHVDDRWTPNLLICAAFFARLPVLKRVLGDLHPYGRNQPFWWSRRRSTGLSIHLFRLLPSVIFLFLGVHRSLFGLSHPCLLQLLRFSCCFLPVVAGKHVLRITVRGRKFTSSFISLFSRRVSTSQSTQLH